MKKYEFNAVIMKHGDIDDAYIEFPYSVEKEFGVKGQVKVKAQFDGHPYRGSLARMGHPCHCLGLTKGIRKLIAKGPGDRIHVVIEQDLEKREVTLPGELKALFSKDSGAREFFEKLSYTHQKEYVVWIESAKQPETRLARTEKAIEMLNMQVKSK